MKHTMKQTILILLAFFCITGALFASETIRSDGSPLIGLEELVSRVLKDDASVREAYARYEKERSRLGAREADFLPLFKTELYEAASTGERTFLTYFDTSVEEPLFEGGKRIALKNEAEVRVQKEHLKLTEAKRDLEIFVRSTYTEALCEEALTKIAQEKVKTLSALHKRERRIYKKGLMTKEELLKSETKGLDAKQSLVKHKEMLDYHLSILQELSGIPEKMSIGLEQSERLPEMVHSFDAYKAQWETKNPAYLMGHLEVKEKEFDLRALQAERYPKLSLAARWNVNRDVFVDTNRGMIGITGKWNIWDFGRLSHEIEAKQHELEEIRAQAEVEMRKREREFRMIYHQTRAAFEKVRMEKSFAREREEAFKNAKVKQITRDGSMKEAEDAFLLLADAKERTTEAVTDYRLLLIRLETRARETSSDAHSLEGVS